MKLHRLSLCTFGMIFIVLCAHAETVSRSVPLTTNIVRVYLNGSHELHLTQGEDEYVKLTAPEEMLARVEARVKGKSLYLGRRNKNNSWGAFDLSPPVRFDVQLKQIEAIRMWGSGQTYTGDLEVDRLKVILAGSGKIIMQTVKARKLNVEIAGSGNFQGDSIESKELEIQIAGSGKIDIAQVQVVTIEIDIAGSGDVTLDNLNAEELEIDIAGSADIDIAGYVKRQELEINGSGDYSAADLISDYAEIEIRGSGDVDINVQQRLIAEISRGADLVYHAGPELEVDISGNGKHRYAGNSRRN